MTGDAVQCCIDEVSAIPVSGIIADESIIDSVPDAMGEASGEDASC